MIGSKPVVWAIAAMAVVGAYGLSLSETRAENVPEPVVPNESAAPDAGGDAAAKPAPHTPIRFKTVDFQDAGEGPGRLKLAGTAAPGTMLYIFVDDSPYVKVLADAEGQWSAEGDLQLDGERHMLRAEQYDPVTKMLAGRAMVAIARSKPGSEP